MNRIRIGKDFKIKWTIWNKETGAAYNLENRNLTLYLNTPRGRIVVRDFSVTGNLIEWNFAGKDQKMVGLYSLVLIENLGDVGMCTIDKVNAFALVAHSQEEKITSEENIDIDTLEFDGAISLASSVALSDWSINEEGYGYVKNRTHYEGVVRTITESGSYEFPDRILKVVHHAPGGKMEYLLQHGSKIQLSSSPPGSMEYSDNVLTVSSVSTTWLSYYPIEVYEVIKQLDERFIPDTIARSEDLAKVSESVQEQIDNIPIAKGEAENSAVLKGGDNQAISEKGVALGSNNLVGLKGFYYKHIRFVPNTLLANVYLSKTQVIPTITTGGEIKDTTIIPSDYYSKGDTISIVNDNKYDNIATIHNMSEGMIQILWNTESPFTAIKKETELSPEDYTIYCLDKPANGIADIGKYSFANGTDNEAKNSYTEVSGKGNVAQGKFAKVWGKDNIGGYNTTTFGTGNSNLADNSFVCGTNNVNEGNNSVIHGNKNTNKGKRTFVVGNQNTNISMNGSVFGEGNFVGLKGWYYKAISFNKSSGVVYVYLTKTQQIPKAVTSASEVDQEKDIDFPLAVGTIVSIVNDAKYDNKYKVELIELSSYGRIKLSRADGVKELIFDKVETDEDLSNGVFDPEDYSIYCLSQPDSGMFDMGHSSFAAGYNNRATNGKSAAFGFNNHAYGKFSFVEGRDNEAGYAAHAGGKQTKALGNHSHSEGHQTQAFGINAHAEGSDSVAQSDNSHVEGKNNYAGDTDRTVPTASNTTAGNGYAAHVEGQANTVTGNSAHAEGIKNKASGTASHVEGGACEANGNYSHSEGYHTTTKNQGEHSEGKYNISNDNTIHSVGIGSTNTKRKNAHEIMNDGKHYILGIGGYNGTNPGESLDLTTAINNLTVYITTPDDKTSGLMEAIQAGRIIMVKHDEGFFVIASPGPMGEDTNGDPICSLYGIYNNRFYIYNAGVYGISSFTEGDILSDLWFWQEGNIEALKRLCNIPFYPISDEYRDIILGRAVRTEAFISELTGKTWLIDQNDSLYKIVGQGNLMIITQVPETLSYIDEERRAFYVQSISSIFDEQSGYYKVSGVNGFLPAELLYPSDSGGSMDLLFPSTGGHNMVLKTEQELTDEERAQIYKNIGLDSSLSPDSENPVMNKVIATEFESQSVLIEDLQNTKIDKEADDYYPQLSVGLADNLSGQDLVESEISYRQSGGGAISDGVARIESIKGNSVVWNQMIDTFTFTYSLTAYEAEVESKGGEITITSTSSITGPVGNSSYVQVPVSQKLLLNHKYMIAFMIKTPSSAIQVMLGDANYDRISMQGNSISQCSVMRSVSENTSFTKDKLTIYYMANGGEFIEGDTVIVSSVKIYNLTLMFGAGNEPTTIEEFYARIPQNVDLNAYNEGEVIHMDVQNIESQGVNAWDEEWENGSYSTKDGKPAANPDIVRCKNAIAVLPNMTYHFNISIPSSLTDKSYMGHAMFYDSEDVFISTKPMGGTYHANVPTPTNARYMRFYLRTEYGTTYNHGICINISDASINGKYFPYIKRVEDLSIIRKYFPNGMKSAGTAHDEIRYNKTTQKWEKVVRIGVVDMGTLDYTASTSNAGVFYATIADMQWSALTQGSIIQSWLCAKYNLIKNTGISTMEDKSICASSSVEKRVQIKDTTYTGVTSFKAAMSGVMLYYELAEPIIEELDFDGNLDYEVWNGGTEQAISDTPSTPLKADIAYGFNAVGKIKENANEIAQLKATIAQLQAAIASMANATNVEVTE